MNRIVSALSVLLIAFVAAGCGNSPPPQTGFLNDYSNLKADKDGAMRYVSPKLKNYNSFIIEPVQVQAQSKLNDKERAEVAQYFNQALTKELTKRGYGVAAQAGPGVGRVRVALTDIQESKWYMNLHPASKLSGVGTGGASMEGEVVDSASGEQLGAVIQAGKGSQFELDTFSKLDDVKDAINKWAENAGKRLDELRQRA
jgi:hypothetical protein